MTTTTLETIYVTIYVSLEKHHAKGPVLKRRYFVMEYARKRLCNVTVNACMSIISLLIVMERVQLFLKWCSVMENARIELHSVTVNVWMKVTSLLTVMEPVQILLKIGSAILFVSPVKNLAMENALKVN
jgi:hypothetical protein